MLYIDVTKNKVRKNESFEVARYIQGGLNDARRCISREYPCKYIYRKDQLPEEFEVKFRHNISGLSMPHWCHVFYVKAGNTLYFNLFNLPRGKLY